jgi:hypothetical protein
VTQLVLHLYECDVESVAESVADPAATEAVATTKAAPNPTAAESVVEPLYSIADPAATDAAPTETFCLCVQV